MRTKAFLLVTALTLVTATATATATATTPTAAATATAPAATPRASLTDIELDVMCVSCREPLALAQSPQAESERSFIRNLIAHGLTKAQIERQLVAQYGPAVLGKPPAHGFNLTVYILPPALLLAGAAILLVALPRWRRRTSARAAQSPAPAAPTITSEDRHRLAEDLARFD